MEESRDRSATTAVTAADTDTEASSPSDAAPSPVPLCESAVCRLCAERSDNGTPLFAPGDQDVSAAVNRYLPLKVHDDGKFPRTICPGCNIQLDAMVQFMELVIAGQEKLRDLWKGQLDAARRKDKETKFLEKGLFDVGLGSLALFPIEDEGKEILFQLMPDGSLYAPDHEMTLKVEGLEKPKRKRGRPPKPPPEIVETEPVKEEPEPEPEEDLEDDTDGRKRRRRKVPKRYREAVQGKELERIFREEGVIDEEEESEEEEEQLDDKTSTLIEENGDEVIGHLENKDGQDLGELVIVNKVKNKPRSKTRRKKTYTCDVCGRGFMHHGRFMMHKNFHKGIRFECAGCNEIFLSKDNLLDHQRDTEHSGEIIVEGLENETDPDQGLEENDTKEEEEETVINTADMKNENKYFCEHCNKSFMSKQSYDVHLKAIHQGQKPFSCEICEKAFAYASSLKSHMVLHEQRSEKAYQCDVCEKEFNHPSSVIYHKEAEHNNGRRFVCNKCGKSFKHKQLLQRHQLVHSNDRPFTCLSCGATFKTRANLMNHQPTHTGIKKYFCQQCGQLFAHKTSLTLHYRWHSGQKPYECTVCKKAFSQKGNLQEHKRIHTGEKPFCCDFCGRKFTTSSQFKLHVKRHTGEKPWNCEYCSKSFLHKDTWKCHMRRHRNEKPYKCDSCMRGFTEQWALKKHQRLHTGEKPYVCEICNKAFADCSNLTKHKKVHRNFKDSLENITAQAVTDGNQIFYVTYQDAESNEVPAFVHILEDGTTLQTSDGALTNSSESLENHLLATDQARELGLETFDDNTDLSLGNEILQVTDEDGNPIYYTTQDGQQLRVMTIDGENLQATTDEGDIIPIQLSVENGKPVAVAVPQQTSNALNEKVFDASEEINQQVLTRTNSVMESDVNNLIDQSVQFMTEDGQNVCLVTSYNIDTANLNASYLPIT